MAGATVTVVIPAFRAARTIGRAVQSVLDQTCPPTEVLVVDDGSPDDVVGALAPWGDRVRILRKANGGTANARNLGIDRARGDFVAFLDADDYWEPVKLETQLAVFKHNPDVGLVAGQFFEEMPGAMRVPSLQPDERHPFNCVLKPSGENAFAAATRVWTGTVIVRRAMLGEQRFVSGLEPAEDRDLWVRLVALHPIYMLSEPLATAVLEPDSISRSNIDADCSNMLKVVRRHEDLLGRQGLRRWESIVYGRWAGNHLAQGRPRQALRYAWRRLRLEPFSLRGWWVLFKSVRNRVFARTSYLPSDERSG
jgi:glycosyltransferase involved in cell wall biosynthesis